jgi:mono/diheme cytochrome c family protein
MNIGGFEPLHRPPTFAGPMMQMNNPMMSQIRRWMQGLITLVVAGMLASCGAQSAPPEPKSMAQENIAPNETGKKLFYTKCASCHFVNKELSGPALKGVEERWPDKALLYAFIRNSEAVVASNKYARELWLQYNQTIMPKNEDLTDEQIRAILDYVASVSIQD